MNGSGFVHGGALMTFADYTIFVIAREALAGHGSVTVSTNSDFVDAGRAGQLIECRGEVVGRSVHGVRARHDHQRQAAAAQLLVHRQEAAAALSGQREVRVSVRLGSKAVFGDLPRADVRYDRVWTPPWKQEGFSRA